jgi:putative N6-adenine-specific DNA methylase
VVTCLPGLEPILSSELRSLRIDHRSIPHGAQLTEPSIETILKCNLFLGSATNILLRCGEPFSARGLAELRRKTARLPWHEIVRGDKVRLQAKVTTSKSKLYHLAAIQARVVAGFYEALGHDGIPSDRTTVEIPSSIAEDDPLVHLEVQITRDQVEIWLCAALTPLHRRGYRLETSKAPLREDLAYAMLYAAGWSPAWNTESQCPYELLLDPLCGSGTIAIEGASMLAGLAPGRLRPPPLVGTCYENSILHHELLTASMESAISVEAPAVFASDRDSGAVAATRSNAERAGVLKYMDIQNCALSAHPLLSNNQGGRSLLVVTNPPFGRRVSNSASSRVKQGKVDIGLLPLYQSLRQLTVDRPNTRTVLLAQGTELVQRAGWNVDELFRSTHGGLSVAAFRSNSNAT